MSETENKANPGTELPLRSPRLPAFLSTRRAAPTRDPRAAKRAERQVAPVLPAVGAFTALFVIAFIKIPVDATVNILFSTATVARATWHWASPSVWRSSFIGAGAIHWGQEVAHAGPGGATFATAAQHR